MGKHGPRNQNDCECCGKRIKDMNRHAIYCKRCGRIKKEIYENGHASMGRIRRRYPEYKCTINIKLILKKVMLYENKTKV